MVNEELLSPYRHKESVINNLPPMVKLFSAIFFIIATVMIPGDNPAGYAVGAVILLGVAILSRISLYYIFKRFLMVEPFVLGIAFFSLFQPDGLSIFILIMIRSSLCILCLTLLTVTTSFSDLTGVLWRLRIPAEIVTIMALMYRYLFLLFTEQKRMRQARMSRTFADGRKSQWKLRAAVLGNLFIRTAERSGRIYNAMCARGWKT